MAVQLEVDRFGRVLIPKALRKALALEPGETLEAELKGGLLELKPATRSAELVEHAGRLVLAAPGSISGDPVEDFRAERETGVYGEW